MRIAVVIDAWYPVVGGSQTHVWELSFGLVNNCGYEVDIFTRALIDSNGTVCNQSEEYFNRRLRIIRVMPAAKLANIWGRISTIFTVAARAVAENRKKKYDLIHAHSILGGLSGKIVKIFIKRPLLFTVHGSPNLDRGKKNLEYYIEKFILTGIRYNHVISVGKKFGCYPNVNKEITNIPNGVSPEKFLTTNNPQNPNYFKILFVGRLDWPKGLDYLIDAVKLLKDNHGSLINGSKVQIHLIGYGFHEQRYRAEVESFGLNELIIFRGKITEENLINEYQSSRLFILPSICEGQPITLLEAMASRLPVLTTFSADNSDIIDPATGWKVHSRDASALAETILEILQTPSDQLKKMGEKGRRKIMADFRWDIIIGRTIKIYNSLT